MKVIDTFHSVKEIIVPIVKSKIKNLIRFYFRSHFDAQKRENKYIAMFKQPKTKAKIKKLAHQLNRHPLNYQ